MPARPPAGSRWGHASEPEPLQGEVAPPPETWQRARDVGVGDGAVVLALAVATGVLYHAALGLWWMADDFFYLRFVRSFRPSRYLLDPAVWQRLPFRMLTPLLLLSLGGDLTLFGPRPAAFYVHQLIAITLLAGAFHALLRLWLPLAWSALGAFLLLAGPPVTSLALEIMVRHYPECLLLMVLATLTWVLGLRARGRSAAIALTILSAALWLAASLAKEIAVPLIFVLPLLPEGEIGMRLRRLLPHALGLGLYLLYRRYLLGVLVGGYGWVIEGWDWLRLAALLPIRIGGELLGTHSLLAWVALAAVLAGCGALVARSRRGALLVGVGCLLALLPLVPVSAEVAPHWAMVTWIALVAGFVFGARRLPAGGWLAVVALIALLGANRQLWVKQLARSRRDSNENRALLALGPGDVLRQPVGTPSSHVELRLYAQQVAHRDGGSWFADDLYLCLPGHPIRRLWQYDEASDRVRDVTGELGTLRHLECGERQRVAPLSASFRYDDAGVLRWTLGPYRDGGWSFVLADGVEAFAVPSHGAFKLWRRELALRIRYHSPAGWSTYSPLLSVPLIPGQEHSWRRPP